VDPKSDPDRALYRRRQRRRALIGWSILGLIVILVGLGIAFGDDNSAGHSGETESVNVFSSEMTFPQYQQIHKGESESLVLNRLGNVGVQEDQVAEAEATLFPHQPSESTCAYWKLAEAPDHLIRLCFSDPRGVLLQKMVRAPGEGESAETTLA
jgi:hypothetical protein